MFFCDDDDTAVIALWIISIGFVILAIDKTTRLSHKPACNNNNEKSIQPLIQLNKQINGKNKNGNDNDEDMQFKRIEQQISQLRESVQDIKKNLQENPSKNGGKKDDRKKSGE
ncbi:TMhelix containing protein [Brevibacillus sp. IT-7CA2]